MVFGVVDEDHKDVFRLGLIVYLYFLKRSQAAHGNSQGEDIVFRVSLFGTDEVFANLQLGEFSVLVQDC